MAALFECRFDIWSSSTMECWSSSETLDIYCGFATKSILMYSNIWYLTLLERWKVLHGIVINQFLDITFLLVIKNSIDPINAFRLKSLLRYRLGYISYWQKLERKQMNDCQFARVDSFGIVTVLLKNSLRVSAKNYGRKPKRGKEKNEKRKEGKKMKNKKKNFGTTAAQQPHWPLRNYLFFLPLPQSLLLLPHLIKPE